MSNHISSKYGDQMMREIEAVPEEYRPALLSMIRIFRQSITLKPADLSFQQGWEEAMQGETYPIKELWDGIVE
jgi:hypothetical protein